MLRVTVFLAFVLTLTAALPALAGGKSSDGWPAYSGSDAIFTPEERRIIREVLAGVEHLNNAVNGEEHRDRDYVYGEGRRESHKNKKHKNGGLPPGLAKRDGDLPPGLERHIQKYGVLPPGLEKRDLPEDLEHRLGKPRKGTRRQIVNKDVVLIEEATGVILDVIEGVLND